MQSASLSNSLIWAWLKDLSTQRHGMLVRRRPRGSWPHIDQWKPWATEQPGTGGTPGLCDPEAGNLVIFCKASFLEMVTWVIWRNLSCSWGIVTFSIASFEFQVVFMSPLLEMYTRCGAFRIQVALMNQAPLETESKSTWHDYGSHRTAGLHHASIRQILIPCPFYVESMKNCVFKISDLFYPFLTMTRCKKCCV